jgi:hypothetical protein
VSVFFSYISSTDALDVLASSSPPPLIARSTLAQFISLSRRLLIPLVASPGVTPDENAGDRSIALGFRLPLESARPATPSGLMSSLAAAATASASTLIPASLRRDAFEGSTCHIESSAALGRALMSTYGRSHAPW